MKKILLPVCLALLACTNKKSHDIQRVVLATGDCYGTCPLQVIDVDSTGALRYFGGKYADSTGFFTGKTNIAFFDTLNSKLEAIRFRQLDSSYQYSIDDQSTELFIYYGRGQVKHIYAQSASLPDSIGAVYWWLMKSALRFPLARTTDTLRFPTTIQNGPTPPLPAINLRMAPPEKN